MPLTCPSCHGVMESRAYPRAMGGEQDLDLCWTCQGIWFDPHESVLLTPAGVVALFRHIHESRAAAQPVGSVLNCPRCANALDLRQDLTKAGRFNYYACRNAHGRFTPFTQFMIEKGFVRTLTRPEIAELKARVGTIRCSGCGAPLDLQRDAACGYCRAPLSILDAEAVEKALASYGQTEQAQAVRRHDMLANIALMHERTRSGQARAAQQGPLALDDLLSASLDSLFGLLR